MKSLLVLIGACLGGWLALDLQAATVSTFTGGDPGEGLDMEGHFTYAVNVGPSGPAGRVGDANFTADNVPGVTIVANNAIANGGWGAVDYGETENDRNLSFAMNSIRWASAPTVVTVTLRVEQGIQYKLQLLFHEDCCPGRGFNIVLDGETEVTNFMPGPVQTGDGDFQELKNMIGSVITHEFTADSDEYVIVLDGPSADSFDITDRNAILNGFTLERISPLTDTDNDGLADEWEVQNFGGLAETGTGDPDGDGLTNQQELTNQTSPALADSDGDGLNDGAEINQHQTNPLVRDTDGDGLDDGTEVNTYGSNPRETDSDNDGTRDNEEVAVGTDPADANSKPVLTQIGVITGADEGEGLDLDGTFVYALAIGGPPEAFVTVRDAEFQPLTENEVEGATIQAGNIINNWYQVNYGDSADDDMLEIATSSIRWSDANNADLPYVLLTLENLEVGAQYKVQLMFGEQCCNRGFDVFFNDVLVAKDFNPGVVQGGINNMLREALITRIHFAQSSTLEIRLDGRQASPAFPDHNAILNAVTVEHLAGDVDSDNDGLHDEWERLYFPDLAQTGTGDPDNDGITNADEFAGALSPIVADTIEVTQQPANVTTSANTRATFTVAATGRSSLGSFASGQLTYQWQRAAAGSTTFADIEGATEASYTTPTLQVDTDNGAKYRVQISIPGRSVTSSEVTLTVTPDTAPPTIASVAGNDTFQTVEVAFNERVNAAADNASSYSLSGGVTVNSVERLQDDPTIVRLTTSRQAEDTEYTLTVNGIEDNAGNPIAQGTQATFRSWKLIQGRVKIEIFRGITGTPVENLVLDPRFPNEPDEVLYLNAFSFGEPAFGNTYGDNFGAQLKAFVIPTESGNYDFFLRSDDASQLYLSPNEDFPVVGVDFPIAEETGCCGAFEEVGAIETTFSPIPLEEGEMYAMLALVKEGGGGDWLQVAWRKEGDETPAGSLQPLRDEVWYYGPSESPGPEPGAPAIMISISQGNVVIAFDGTLQAADAVTGPYTDVAGTSPMTIPATDAMKFYRARR